MRIVLNLELQDSIENISKVNSLDTEVLMTFGDNEYVINLMEIKHDLRTGTYGSIYEYGGHTHRFVESSSLNISGRGYNKKEKDIKDAITRVNKAKEQYKEAQRKLSELNGPKAK